MKIVILLLLLGAPIFADDAGGWDAFRKGDYALALKELLPLANQGNASAQCGVAILYAKGQGVRQDYKEALRWCTTRRTPLHLTIPII